MMTSYLKIRYLILVASVVFGCGTALAEEPLALHCVGNMTEKETSVPSRVEVKNTTFQGERYYEFSQDEFIEHLGTNTVTSKRADIEKSVDNGIRIHSGSYTIAPLEIRYNETDTYKVSAGATQTNGSIRSFSINRQTAAWRISETFSYPTLGYPGEWTVMSRTAYGNCEPWSAKPKF